MLLLDLLPLYTGPVQTTIAPAGIASAEAFGTATLSGLLLATGEDRIYGVAQWGPVMGTVLEPVRGAKARPVT